MECSEPGAIRDDELIAYLEGEKVRPTVVEHLARCQKCSSQLASYRQVERKLTHRLYRWDCPPNQVLGDYLLGMLDGDVTLMVQTHLHLCVLCSAELATLTNFLAVEPLVPAYTVASEEAWQAAPQGSRQPLQEIKRTLGQAASGVRRIAALLLPPQPGLAYQRSVTRQDITWPRTYAAQDVTISLQLESGPKSSGTLQLIGFVTRQGTAVDALQGTTARLLTAEGVTQTQQIDELGNLIFSALEPAVYTLEVQLPEGTVVVDQLSLSNQE
ncbi:hypothetical protein KDW_62260 [Dictyobacter vulcani]|uniref:Zinc-finger domain-containing protein n=1 Tax=Dictyobacter vulcani TaxID=2607529 RepID=A0A5J4KRQ0_9CHLR|nr:hypothetical protein [Dictyobacter vulcani]GER92064.1 hypothetical protein KDW_62260 [Dictyobacter vulcani]